MARRQIFPLSPAPIIAWKACREITRYNERGQENLFRTFAARRWQNHGSFTEYIARNLPEAYLE